MKCTFVFCLALIPLLGFAQPQTSEASASAVIVSGNSESLDDGQITQLQQKAIQKLQDFYDYISLLSNRAYEKQMREDARKQAKQLFYGSDCSVNGKIAMTFIDSCFTAKDRIQWKAINIKVKEKMKAKSDVLDSEYYEGVLSFTLSSGKDTTEKYAYVMFAKSGKPSGITGKEAWAVYICDIR
jgi:hypothetical protein